MKENVNLILSQMTLEEKAGLCSGLDFWHFKGVERLGVPALMVCDGPHGLRKQEEEADMMGVNESIPAVCFPSASAMAASFDRELLWKVGETLGEECRAEQVAVLLGPGMNSKRSPLCGRNFEYYSEDPYHSSEMGTAFVKGVQSQGVGTSTKHFLANNQEYDRMGSNSVVDERTLHEIYLASFEGAIKEAKPATVMCSYNKINGTFASENKEMLTDILRNKWGYEGCVITDWGAAKDRVKGIRAGLDIEMPGGNPLSEQKIIKAVKSGELDEKELDVTVERILRLISFCTQEDGKEHVFDRDKDHRIAGAVEKECAVLLKNESLLPLKETQKMVFIGEFAMRPRYQGSGSSHINSKQVTSALDAAKGNPNICYVRGYEENGAENEPLLLEAIKAAKEAEAVVIFAGLPNVLETEGLDRSHMQMPENQNRLIREVANVQGNVVVVLHNGSPIEMPWIDDVKAVLEMYLGGENVGDAAYELLYGKANPCGKLAETFPVKLSDNPSYLNFPGHSHEVHYQEGIYVGYRYYDKKEMEVLFPFGHGLSYTTFCYDHMELSRAELTEDEELKAFVQVTNTGDYKGKEVVQIYISDKESTFDRPIRELKGYQKVELAPGETKTVEITLDKRAFAYYNTVLHDWHVETGEFVIEAGSSSRDIRLQETVMVHSLTEVPMVFERYSTVGEILATEKGRAVLSPLMQAISLAGGDIQTTDAMGEGSEAMVQAMMESMPVGNLVNFGAITEEQLEQVLTALNG